jgi:hypothetical protein
LIVADAHARGLPEGNSTLKGYSERLKSSPW